MTVVHDGVHQVCMGNRSLPVAEASTLPAATADPSAPRERSSAGSEDDVLAPIRQLYSRCCQLDAAGMLEVLAPDVSWNWGAPCQDILPYGGSYQGHEGVREWLQRMAATTELYALHPHSFACDGCRVAAIVHFEAVVKRTGKHFATQCVQMMTLEGGRITSWRNHSYAKDIAKAYLS